MFTKHRLFTAFVLSVAVCAVVASPIVNATWATHPAAFLLRPEEVGATAQIQAEAPLNAEIPGPVVGYLDGARIDFVLSSNELQLGSQESQLGNTYIVNYAYRFANSQLAEMEFNRIHSEITANNARILDIEVALPEKNIWRTMAFEANLKDQLAGTTIRWLFAQKGEYITALMMPGQVTPDAVAQTPDGRFEPYGLDTVNRYNTAIHTLFNQLWEKMAVR